MTVRQIAISLSLAAAMVALPALASAASASASAGAKLYSDNCAMCHGNDGKGAIPGAPNFTKPAGVLAQSNAVLTERILNGYTSKGSPMSMPAMKGQVSAAQVKQILEYIHHAFGVSAAKPN